MKFNGITAVLLFILVAGFAAGQELLIEYVDGKLEVREGRDWYELFIGETIQAGDVVRVTEGTYAEISADGITIKLSEPGTYDTSSMVDQARTRSEANVRSLLATRLRNIGASSRAQSRGTVGGVRGSEAVTQPNTMWVGGESVDDLISEGIDRLAEDDYQEAYWIFEEAYDYSDELSVHRASFYLGYAAALIGETDESLSLLGDAEPDPTSAYYADHVVVLAQLLVETFAYQRALDLLRELRQNEVLDQETEQLVLLLEGAGFHGLGRSREARSRLVDAIDVDPASSIATAARTMLEY